MPFAKQMLFALTMSTVAVFGLAAQETLTLASAREQALAHSKTLSNLNLSVDSAQLDEKSQGYKMMPSASLSSSVSLTLPQERTTDSSGAVTSPNLPIADTLVAGTSITVSQTVWSGGKNSMLLAIDKLSTSIARQAARAEYFSVLDAVDSAYFSLLESRAAADAADAALKVAEVSLSIAETKMEVGAITKTDYLQAESEVESKKTGVSQAQRDYAIARVKLASLTALNPLPEVEDIDFTSYNELIARLADYSNANIDLFIGAVRKNVTANNPSLSKVSLESAKAGKNASLAIRDYLPTITAGYSAGLDYAKSSETSTTSGKLTLSGSIPLDVWTTKNNADIAGIAKKQADLTREETERTVDIDLQTTVLNCIAQARSVISSRKALEYAQKHYENELELYKLSSASVSDLSNASSLVSTNTNQCINARYGFLSCLSAIRSLCALDSDTSVLELIP